MRSDLLWGNLALPISSTLEELEKLEEIRATPLEERTDEQKHKEACIRRQCREYLELSTQQLEEMQEKKGEFGHEYRAVSAGWYMMMLPDTHLETPMMAPVDASKAAWEWMEREYERRRVEGDAAVHGELDHVSQQTYFAQGKQVVELAHVVRHSVRVAVEGRPVGSHQFLGREAPSS